MIRNAPTRRSTFLLAAALASLLLLALAGLALVDQEIHQASPTPWSPAEILPNTPTSTATPGAWWDELPTPAPVQPSSTPDLAYP